MMEHCDVTFEIVLWLHHQRGSPFIVHVINIIQRFDHLLHGFGQVLLGARFQERATKVPI